MKTKMAIVLATVALLCMIAFAFAANNFLYSMNSPVARHIVLENSQGVVLDPTSPITCESVFEGYQMSFMLKNVGLVNTTVSVSITAAVGAIVTLDSGHLMPFMIPINGIETITLTFSVIDTTVSTISWNIGLSYP